MVPPKPERSEHDRAAGLPAPVRAWLSRTIEQGATLHRRAQLEMTGEILLRSWRTFEAHQILAPPDGFVWAATTHVGPLRISGFDRYLDHVGEMRWKLFGRLPLLHAHGPDTTRSAAGRLAGEALLLPACALASWVDWEAVDDHRAIAHVTIDGTIHDVAAQFCDGRLTSCSLPRWFRSGRPAGRSRVFGVRFDGELTVGGVTIPERWTAGWDWDGHGWADGPFFRAHLSDVRFPPT